MDRAYASGASGSAPAVPASPSSGYPTAGNPGTGTPATKPGPYWYHMIVEEMMSIISAAGILPATGNLTQLLTSLRSAGVFQTQAIGDYSSKVATTEFVANAFAADDNKIINAGMLVDQENSGVAVTPVGAGVAAYVVDGICVSQSVGGKITQQQVAAPTGFTRSPKAIKFSVAASYTPAATDYLFADVKVEGNLMADLLFGTSGAKTVSVSFEIQSSVAGIYSLALRNVALNRSYVTTFTIAQANIAQVVTINGIHGDIAGAWSSDNTTGIYCTIALGYGSNFQTSTLNSWFSSSQQAVSLGAVNWVTTPGASLYLSGIKINAGQCSTPFKLTPYDLELGRCQRYFEIIGNTNTAEIDISGYGSASMELAGSIYFKTEKRTLPTVTLVGAFTLLNVTTQPTFSSGVKACWISFNATVAGQAKVTSGAGGHIKVNARL